MVSELEYIITHAFLPLKLPQRDDHAHYRESILAQYVWDAVRDYDLLIPNLNPEAWARIKTALQCFCKLRNEDPGQINKDELSNAIRTMETGGK
jgi:hypothetical protein